MKLSILSLHYLTSHAWLNIDYWSMSTSDAPDDKHSNGNGSVIANGSSSVEADGLMKYIVELRTTFDLSPLPNSARMVPQCFLSHCVPMSLSLEQTFTIPRSRRHCGFITTRTPTKTGCRSIYKISKTNIFWNRILADCRWQFVSQANVRSVWNPFQWRFLWLQCLLDDRLRNDITGYLVAVVREIRIHFRQSQSVSSLLYLVFVRWQLYRNWWHGRHRPNLWCFEIASILQFQSD